METERSQVKLDQILAAAQKRFGHYGLSKTTMNDIADDIGMSKASLYYYFKDKESVFIAVKEKEYEYFAQEINKIVQSSLKAEFMLRAYVDLRIKLMKKLLTLGKFSYGSYLEVKPLFCTHIQKMRADEVKRIADIIQIGLKRKEFFVNNVKKNAEFFVDTMHGIKHAIISEHTGKTTMEISPSKYQNLKLQSRMFTDFFIKGISI